MNENLGDLNFSFRLLLNQWKQDLAAADRDFAEYRRKWETPVNIRGASVGGGTATGAPMASTGRASGGIASGVNFTGTSNGDVTQRLQNAVQSTQDSHVRATGGMGGNPAAMRMLQSLGVSPEAMARATIGGVPVMGGGGAAAAAAAASVAQAAPTASRSSYDWGAMAYRQSLGVYDHAGLRGSGTSAWKNDASDKEEFDAGSGGAGKSPWWKARIPLRSLIRTTIAGLVVDAISGMSAAESKYGQEMTLAGNNQGDQARATLNLRKNMLGSVPFVGGILRNFDAGATGIETDLELNNRRSDLQNATFQMRMGTMATAGRTAAIGMGGNAAQRYMEMNRVNAQNITTNSLLLRQPGSDAYDRANPQPKKDDYGHVVNGNWVVDADAETKWNEGLNQWGAQKRSYMSLYDKKLKGELEENSAEGKWQMRQQQYGAEMDAAEVAKMRMENQFRPGAAQSAYIVSQVTTANKLLGPGEATMTPQQIDQAKRRNNIYLGIETLRGEQTGIREQFLWGRGQQYNPYTQSTLSFTDRSLESKTDHFDNLTKAIQELTQQLKAGGDN